MKIADFNHAHIEEAKVLALHAYQEEQSQVEILPKLGKWLDLEPFADNNLGVAAFENDRMIGFLCGLGPFDHAFQSTEVKGVFSPMGANGAIMENRAAIYAAMYEEAAKKWVAEGAVSHALCLYRHDENLHRQFFQYGFGMRCVDAIRNMEKIDCPSCSGYEFHQLSPEEYSLAYSMELALNQYQRTSPYFMPRTADTFTQFKENCCQEDCRCFAAFFHGKICAYLKLSSGGETFITECSDYIHIDGAFCTEEHRGSGLYQNLINFAVTALKQEGYHMIGVDFESMNPRAYKFWLKYFTAYTSGVVRRIDEHILR